MKLVSHLSPSTRRRTAVAGLAIAFTAVAGACGTDPETASADSETVELTVGVAPSTTSLPVHAAADLGYFEESGLEVTPKTFTSGAAIIPELLRDDLQISIADTVGTMVAVSNDVPLKLFAGASLGASDAEHDYTGIMVPEGSGITDVSDLAGTTLAVNSVGGIAELLGRASLDDAGVDSSTVEFVEIPPASQVDAAVGGKVDGIVAVEPTVATGRAAGMTSLLPASLAVGGAAVGTFMTSDSFAESSPETLAAFAGAVQQAAAYLNEHPDYARQLTQSELEFSAELSEAIVLPVYADESLSPEQLEPLLDIATKYDALATEVTTDDVYLATD